MGCAPSRVKTVPQSVVRLNFEEIDLIISDKKVVEQLKSLAPHEYYKDRDFQGISSLCMDETNIPENIKNKDISWKRPHEYIDNPQLFVDGINRLDIVQGDLGDCWFLCACAAITLKQEIWTRIIPSDNKIFNSKGLYHFRFWRFGDWVDVYIDDLLPMSDGELIYAQAATPSEIWPSLIEKAYAKVNGCYEALQSGKASEGLLDLTGGLTEVYYPPQMKGPELFNVMRQALRNGAFVACNTDNEHDGSRGLITGHAYSVTMANKIPTIEGPKDLLRIFNPWGATEWTGDWSDASDKWHLVPPEVRKTLGLKQELDGEFWMNFNDFCQFFSRVYICTLGPDFDRDGIVDNSKMYSFHGSWIPGHNAGGCSDDIRRYSTNPQYRFTVDSDTKASPTENSPDLVNPLEVDRCFIIVSLMQKFQRSLKKRDLRKSEEYINFRLYKVNESEAGKCNEEFFTDAIPIEPVLGEMDYTNTREVTSRFLLQPGEYLLVPSTFDHDVLASFLLRLYAWTSQFKCWEAHDS